MSVTDKIDKFLNEVKHEGYWKIGVSNKFTDTPKVMEVVSSKDQVNKARKAYAGKYKNVFVQSATKKDFSDYSNGRNVKWIGKWD